MRKAKQYRFNKETLSYEAEAVSASVHIWRGVVIFVLSLLFFVAGMWLITSVPSLDFPKQMILRMKNASWRSRFEILSKRMDICEASLEDMAERDDKVYRTLFGLGVIPSSARYSGISGINRYAYLEEKNQGLADQSRRLDRMLKMAVVQSRSFDEVEVLSERAGEISQIIPAICPVSTEPGTFRYSSSFGYRRDPLNGRKGDRHTGIDLACSTGTPVYAPGDGVVTMAQRYHGYGNFISINHGFGYQTRYGHLHSFLVEPGDSVKRGDCIAYSGNSGRSTGSHLHYEVIFRGDYVNPIGFLDMEMPIEDYRQIVRPPEEDFDTFRKKKRK